MKKFTTLLFSLFLIGYSAQAASVASEDVINSRYDGKAYIFVENGVEFSVFPDGQFDFVYAGPQDGGNVAINIDTPNVDVSYNSGYDYEAYVQYDDYGAVIQVEDVPIYYDDYGRIIQAGEVDIRYRNRRLVTVGSLNIHYNNYGYYSHCTGYINYWNRFYVYRPWHVYYARPFYSNCIVYDYGYRQYYNPYRYSYYQHSGYYNNRHRVAYNNGRRSFYRPGMRQHYKNGRHVANRDYKANRRNSVASNNPRRGDFTNKTTSRGIAKRDNGSFNSKTTSRGIAKRDGSLNMKNTSRGIAKRDGSLNMKNTSRGIAKRNGSLNMKNTSRGIAKRDGSLNKKSTSRGIAKKRPAGTTSSRGIAQKKSTARPQQKRATVSRSKGNTVKRNTTKSAPRKVSSNKSSNSKSKKSTVTRSTSSSSKSQKRGRGL